MEVETTLKIILVVDDQQQVRELVEATLRNEEYHILQACNGEEAIETAKSRKPELILMDIIMPGIMDGIEATRIIKNDSRTKDCKVIMLTAKGQENDKENGCQAGAAYYFVKPFSPLELIRKVEEVLK